MPDIRLGVNIDHVATLRQARGGQEPSPLQAAKICEKAGADNITVHLREDQRHIQSHDVFALKKILVKPLNLEMALHPFVIKLALELKPRQVTLVPERRRELTTEKGLDVAEAMKRITHIIPEMQKQGIQVALFIDPDETQAALAAETGVTAVEFHTGDYANAQGKRERAHEWKRLAAAAEKALSLKLHVHAGHGLNYENIASILDLPGLEEVNIGHAIISRALFTGLEQAVRDMAGLVKGERIQNSESRSQ